MPTKEYGDGLLYVNIAMIDRDRNRHTLCLALFTAHISMGVKLDSMYFKVSLVGDYAIFSILLWLLELLF
jgi:hypothetical protein